MKTASQFWKDEVANDDHYASRFACMNSWTVGMFNVVMEFAEKYSEYRLSAAIPEVAKEK